MVLHVVVAVEAGGALRPLPAVWIPMALGALAMVLELVRTAQPAVAAPASLDLLRRVRLVAVRAIGMLRRSGRGHAHLTLVATATGGPPLQGSLMGIVARGALVLRPAKLLRLRPMARRAGLGGRRLVLLVTPFTTAMLVGGPTGGCGLPSLVAVHALRPLLGRVNRVARGAIRVLAGAVGNLLVTLRAVGRSAAGRAVRLVAVLTVGAVVAQLPLLVTARARRR